MKNKLVTIVAVGLLAGSVTANAAYWSVFNVEGESGLSANIVTYNFLTDMLTDTNRTGVFIPNPLGFGRNIVGSGSDEFAFPVPEPGALALLLTGLAGLGFARRRNLN